MARIGWGLWFLWWMFVALPLIIGSFVSAATDNPGFVIIGAMMWLWAIACIVITVFGDR